MIVFELTMPGIMSWNGKWSGNDSLHIITRPNYVVPKNICNKSFRYRWDDGWEACISVTKMDWKTARKLKEKSTGFCGYDWMVTSLIQDGYIHPRGE